MARASGRRCRFALRLALALAVGAVGAVGTGRPARALGLGAQAVERADADADATDTEGAGERDGPSEPLPINPLLTRGRLENGLAYWIQPLRVPAGTVSIWLRIGSGSLNESRDQRGVAHFLEHMAFSGSENFPRGEAIRSFESLGLRLGQDENASTDFRDTTFQLALPDARPETIRRALTLMADFAFRQTLRPVEIERERGVVLQELRTAHGLGERLDDQLRELLFAGSRVADRPPRGAESVVRAAGRAALHDYLRRWYRPDDTTLLIVGDVDPQTIVPLVAAELGAWRAAGRPAPAADPGVHLPAASRVTVITDVEMPLARVSLDWLQPLAPLRTVVDYRRRLVDDLAVGILDRRLDRRLDQRTGAAPPPFQSAYAEAQAVVGTVRQISVEAFARAARWREALGAALAEVERARRQGCVEAELGDAARARLARSEREAAAETARDARDVLSEMRAALAEGWVPPSKAQTLALDRALLPTITPDEVTAALSRTLDPRTRATTLILPRRPGLAVPTRAQLLAAARAVDAPPGVAARPQDEIDHLLDSEPAPEAIGEPGAPSAAGVWSLTLANGVRVHLRPTDGKATGTGVVELEVTLAGGELLETTATRGLSAAAALAFSRPSTSRLPAAAIHRYLRARNIDVWGCACDADGLTLGITTDAHDAGEAMHLAHLVLTKGRVDGTALRVWKDRQNEAATLRPSSPERQLDERVGLLVAGGDSRARRPRVEEIARIDLAASQRWLERHLATAPVEVALVGDLPLDTMRALAQRYLGSLPARPVVDPALAARRRIPIKAGPLEASLPVETNPPRAVVTVGWRGAEAGDERDRQVLDLAARIVSDRLIEELRERRGLAYRFSCDSTPAVGLVGTGTLAVQVVTEPRRARWVAALGRTLVERLAREGPTASELAMARRQQANERRHDEVDPDFWADTLSTLDLRGVDLGEVAAEPERLDRITGAQVRDVLARYVLNERRFQAVALPRPRVLAVSGPAAPTAMSTPATAAAAMSTPGAMSTPATGTRNRGPSPVSRPRGTRLREPN